MEIALSYRSDEHIRNTLTPRVTTVSALHSRHRLLESEKQRKCRERAEIATTVPLWTRLEITFCFEPPRRAFGARRRSSGARQLDGPEPCRPHVRASPLHAAVRTKSKATISGEPERVAVYEGDFTRASTDDHNEPHFYKHRFVDQWCISYVDYTNAIHTAGNCNLPSSIVNINSSCVYSYIASSYLVTVSSQARTMSSWYFFHHKNTNVDAFINYTTPPIHG